MPERDPDRLYLRTTTGDVQAWRPECGACPEPSALLRPGPVERVAVSVAFQTRDGAAHASYGHYMTVADARSLAAALLAAADHVDGLTTEAASD